MAIRQSNCSNRHGSSIRALVLDYDMPKRNGIECLEILRENGYQTPAILITGVADESLEDRLPGRSMLLRKPFAIGELSRLIRTLTETSAEDEHP